MLKNGIQWLMIILIATQSVWSMADAHSAHQSGLEHLEFEHQHDDAHPAKQGIEKSTLDASQADFDCHHCCHCHGAHSSFITSFYASVSLFGQSPQHSFTKPLELTQQPSVFFRPPRA